MRVVILSGISGSGKTTFLRALEDVGYFCVDNLPLVILEKFLELCNQSGEKMMKSAFVVDIREKIFFEEGKEVLQGIKDRYGAEITFLESSEDTVLKRYRETRRSHPLFAASNIKEALHEERRLVNWIKDVADRVIDTSQLNPHELRRFVLNTYGYSENRMRINLMSFGYAYGIPAEADMILDVRFLSNPFFVEGLREKTGLSQEVKGFIESDDVYRKFFHLLLEFLLYLMPLFEKEGKSYLTICFGCTGGKHRSVSVVNELGEQFMRMNYNISIVHRDVDK